MTRAYELMVVVRPTVDVTDQTKQEAVVSKLLGNGSTVQKITLIGKKQLAYLIDGCTEGIYLLADVSAQYIHTADLEKHMRLGTDVLRYLLTVKE